MQSAHRHLLGRLRAQCCKREGLDRGGRLRKAHILESPHRACAVHTERARKRSRLKAQKGQRGRRVQGAERLHTSGAYQWVAT